MAFPIMAVALGLQAVGMGLSAWGNSRESEEEKLLKGLRKKYEGVAADRERRSLVARSTASMLGLKLEAPPRASSPISQQRERIARMRENGA